MTHNVINIATTTAALLFIVALHHAHSQPTLNKDLPDHGPNDRFTEGTKIHTIFNEIDLNGDKKLDEHEVHLYFQQQGAQVPDGLWDKEDKNRDGVIELHEFARGEDEDEL
mmetsp:Transcript_25270/g.41443  ORF Transcript_25270/g.41443 Transcript_25270/m.41443 type:complete len:111 (+) Transcript_25270:3-335(+)